MCDRQRILDHWLYQGKFEKADCNPDKAHQENEPHAYTRSKALNAKSADDGVSVALEPTKRVWCLRSLSHPPYSRSAIRNQRDQHNRLIIRLATTPRSFSLGQYRVSDQLISAVHRV